MARVYVEFVKNTFMEHPDYLMLALFMVTVFMSVSIQNVLTNIPKSDLLSALNFLAHAIQKTNWIIQVLIAVFAIRITVSSVRLAYKNMGNNWVMAKLRY